MFDSEDVGKIDSLLELFNNGVVNDKVEKIFTEKEINIEEPETEKFQELTEKKPVFNPMLF